VPRSRASGPTRRSWSPRCGRSRCTAASARSWRASRSIPALLEENVEAVRLGAQNLAKQIENVRLFGSRRRRDQLVPDRHAGRGRGDPEVALAPAPRRGRGARTSRRRRGCRGPRRGGLGRREEGDADFQLLYPTTMPLAEKIETIATRVYGADGIDVLPAARKAIKQYEDLGSATCRSAWPRRSTR
jgi:formate--tetrahydrofolate ligase